MIDNCVTSGIIGKTRSQRMCDPSLVPCLDTSPVREMTLSAAVYSSHSGRGIMGRSSFRIAAALCITLACSISRAQSTFGSFVGTVHDPSGAAIASCMVSVTNKGTSAKRTTLTNEKGDYVLVNLEPGAYELAIA